MPTGKHRPPTPAKANHMSNFDAAMKDALRQWNGNQDDDVPVKLEVTVSPNPGGIKEYRVIVGGP